MKNFKYFFKTSLYLNLHLNLSLTLAFTFISCSPSLVNLDTAKSQVVKYYESGEYEKEITEIINDAKEKFSKVEVKPNSLVVFDIDETALDNYQEIKRIGFGYEHKIWDEWLQKAEAPAIPQVKDLYDYLVQNGFKVAFISGKRDYQYTATLKNMLLAGYTKFDTIITRNADEYKMKSAYFKALKRKELSEKGYDIVGCIGDQVSDCVGENCGIIVKLPNYLYLVE